MPLTAAIEAGECLRVAAAAVRQEEDTQRAEARAEFLAKQKLAAMADRAWEKVVDKNVHDLITSGGMLANQAAKAGTPEAIAVTATTHTSEILTRAVGITHAAVTSARRPEVATPIVEGIFAEAKSAGATATGALRSLTAGTPAVPGLDIPAYARTLAEEAEAPLAAATAPA